MSTAQLAAVSYFARYAGRTHVLYAFHSGSGSRGATATDWIRWLGLQGAHVELYIRQLGEHGLMDSSVVTMMHAVRGHFQFAHIDGLTGSNPAVYARLPNLHRDESRTLGLDRLELIRYLQVAQTITVRHGASQVVLSAAADVDHAQSGTQGPGREDGVRSRRVHSCRRVKGRYRPRCDGRRGFRQRVEHSA